ncbi:type III secretion system chaperone [Hyphomicrobium sp. MC1]|uniref:type III secretion system chaperone n=1 Tax=Hyphomicrobium sp. (strain MC1) TaxID=717785 RepID=UPI000213EDA7|nr:type III secretion system chaperone [Hyphomicrobium sp. MC1]CCB66663.1 protein of unknown function [Hyphomicrobium sp. MC1]
MPTATYLALIKEMGAHIGLPDMEADEGGYLAITLEKLTLHLQYDEEEDEVALFARLGEVEEDRTEAIYAMLLGANLFWQGTRGATLAIEPSGGSVFFMDRRALPVLRADSLVSWIERFHEMAAYWSNRLAVANEGGPIGVADDEISIPTSDRQTYTISPSFIRG